MTARLKTILMKNENPDLVLKQVSVGKMTVEKYWKKDEEKINVVVVMKNENLYLVSLLKKRVQLEMIVLCCCHVKYRKRMTKLTLTQMLKMEKKIIQNKESHSH